MTVTIDFDDELTPVIQEHLNSGVKVQLYIRAAVHYFNEMRKAEESGAACGFGDKARFGTYNKVFSPKECLKEMI